MAPTVCAIGVKTPDTPLVGGLLTPMGVRSKVSIYGKTSEVSETSEIFKNALVPLPNAVGLLPVLESL